jgi:hypothetical protein
MKKAVGLCVSLILVVIALISFQRRLSVEVITEHADIGIPGTSKVYLARIKNIGIVPVFVTRCEAVDDAFGNEVFPAYKVEKWDDKARSWVTVADMGKSFCKPYPLGIISAKRTRKLLWPGQTLETNWEATAARDAFRLGNHARFVVFLNGPDDKSRVLETQPFRIDEMTTATGVRVAH